MEIKAKNKLDFDYLSILNDIIENGNERDTRAGKAKSLFGKQLRIDLTKGFPLLTTKKIFTRGFLNIFSPIQSLEQVHQGFLLMSLANVLMKI